MKHVVLIFLAFLASNVTKAQTDTLQPTEKPAFEIAPSDTIKPKSKTGFSPDPKKASLYSLAFPGLGQAYNRKYWKIPILAAGFGTIIYFIRFNNQNYKIFRDAANQRARGEEDPFINIYTDIAQLRIQREFYRRNRDLLVILAAGLYALNIVDAAVDAHLSSFNITDDLSAGVEILPPVFFSKNALPGFEFRLVKRF